MAEKFRRKKYFIAKQSQSKFIIRFVVIAMAGSLISLGLFVFLAHRKIDETLYSMRLPNTGLGSLLLPEMITASLVIFCFIVVLFAVTSWRLLKKLNGPLHKISQEMQRAAAGNMPVVIILRKNDEFQDFAEELNSMLAIIHGQLILLHQQNSELKHEIENILTPGATETAAGNRKNFDQLRRHMQAMHNTLEKFSV